jgi:AbrB family looped-hinge helix DNA binding protein
MRATTTMTSQGRITIPLEIRRHLGLQRGDRLAFSVVEGVVTLQRLTAGTGTGGDDTLLADADVAAWLDDLRGGP